MMMKIHKRGGAAMVRCAGFTLNEAVVTAAILVVVLLVALAVLPMLVRPGYSRPARRTLSATHLKDMYNAMYQYSVSNNEHFPIAGAADPAAEAIGFAEGNRTDGTGAKLDNNVTASLWLLVREGALTPEQFINVAKAGAVPDFVTVDGRAGSAQMKIGTTYDFSRSENLSYSPINMYHVGVGDQWSSNVQPEYVLMGDDNNNDWAGTPGRHAVDLSSGLSARQVQDHENSRNHNGEGQNFMYGDGHVAWHVNPFVGVGGDNVYAMTKGGANAPPTLGNSDGDAATDKKVAKRDTFLLPITGNGGGVGSLDPTD